MRAVPRWALVSATAAPVLLIGGWSLAAARQPGGFDAVRDTISALAARDATDRWIMTTGLAGLGAAHLVTAVGLRTAARPGRLMLALGGLATLAVAAFPQPGEGGGSITHVLAAGVAFVALACWPALAVPLARQARPAAGPAEPQPRPTAGPAAPQARPAAGPLAWQANLGWAATGAAVLLLALVGWFAVEYFLGGPRIGLSERVAAGAEALCPLLAVLTALLTTGWRDDATGPGRTAERSENGWKRPG